MPRSPESFVKARRDSWSRLQELVDKSKAGRVGNLTDDDLHQLGLLYRRTASDLARAQTRYRGTLAGDELVRSLNALVLRAHALLYLAPTGTPVTVGSFFVYEFPAAVRRQWKVITIAALLMYLPALFAYLCVWSDPSSSAYFVPQSVVEEVHQRAEKKLITGWGGRDEYQGAVESPAIGPEIMVNNIRVTAMAVALGVTAGLGTALVLITNGLMVGALAGVATNYHVDLLFWAVILPHGVLELSAISISGGAGLLLARALYAPGDLSHRDAFQVAGVEAGKLLMGVAAMLVLAGSIEGFLTPAPLDPALKLAFAAGTAVFLGGWLTLKPRPAQA